MNKYIGKNRILILVMVIGCGVFSDLFCAQYNKQELLVKEYTELKDLSDKFNEKVYAFPIDNNRIKKIAGDDPEKQCRIVEHAKSVRPLIDDKVIIFFKDFLNYKQNEGNVIEKNVYKDMTVQDFIIRLLEKRPLVFTDSTDNSLLRDGKTTVTGGFENIGTEKEKCPLTLENYLSYEEMGLGSLLGMSLSTFFINKGERDNFGIKEKDKALFEQEAVFAGLIGVRFENKYCKGYHTMIVDKDQNTTKNGYGLKEKHPEVLSLWSKLYGGVQFPTFEEVEQALKGQYLNDSYVKIQENRFLNKVIFKKHMTLMLTPFFIDANNRGLEVKKNVYVRLNGIGLGVWAVDVKEQVQCIIEVVQNIVSSNELEHIANIDFNYFPRNSCVLSEKEYSDKKDHRIKIGLSEKGFSEKLTGDDEGKLLVASYAWDSNSFPGNEYFNKTLSSSDDPAAACCSTIAELQNPLINSFMSSIICDFCKSFDVGDTKDSDGKNKKSYSAENTTNNTKEPQNTKNKDFSLLRYLFSYKVKGVPVIVVPSLFVVVAIIYAMYRR